MAHAAERYCRNTQTDQGLPRLLGAAEEDRSSRPQHGNPSGRNLRAARTQRFRQDHDHQAAARPALPTDGEAFVFGQPAADVRKNERIGYLPEESYLYRFLNAEETLDFYGRLFNLPPGEARIQGARTDRESRSEGGSQTHSPRVFQGHARNASVWPRRSSTIPTSSFSTSRPPASIRWARAG